MEMSKKNLNSSWSLLESKKKILIKLNSYKNSILPTYGPIVPGPESCSISKQSAAKHGTISWKYTKNEAGSIIQDQPFVMIHYVCSLLQKSCNNMQRLKVIVTEKKNEIVKIPTRKNKDFVKGMKSKQQHCVMVVF